MPAPDVIVELVQRFKDNEHAYKSGSYNETQVRREFLDPFFTSLGWDVENKQGYAEAYKDVVHEDAIKISGSSRAPDYSFRVGGTRKFFVEAKKPAVNLSSDASPAFQLRRYAWSAKLPLSILTDFEELAVYDGRIQPDKDDLPAIARVRYYTYNDYQTKWEEIAAIFSREAVLKGAFDRFADDKKARRGTAQVDSAFLTEIETWRNALAQDLAKRNPQLNTRNLNFAVQKTIDRIIFLRICEDRGIENLGRIQSLLNGKDVYERLCVQFREADERYNSGLFHFHTEKGRGDDERDTLTPSLKISDGILKEIVKSLYYPAPYAFEVFPADILGQVYEQFLGKVITLDSKHQATVTEKPEVRKAGGVYYTPTYIVNYIVGQTVGKLIEGKSPKQASGLRFLDPACGSGSFLIGAYQTLLDWHLDWYIKDGPDKHAKGKAPVIYQTGPSIYRLTTSERRRILLNNVYGVDIDPQAVEVTKLSLLLKMLEGETQQSVQSQTSLSLGRVLPDLGGNIKCGNSLIASDYYADKSPSLFNEEEMFRVNVFDWQKAFPQILTGTNPGFDAVIGNPPYRMLQPHNTDAPILDYLKNRFVSASYKVEFFHLFLQRGGEVLKQNGKLGYIVPTSILNNVYAEGLRNWLANRFAIESISVARGKVFANADVHTSILVFVREDNDALRQSNNVETTTKFGVAEDVFAYPKSSVKQSRFKQLAGQVWNVMMNESNSDMLLNLIATSKPLNSVATINRGLITGAKGDFFSDEQRTDKYVHILAGGDVHRYAANSPSQYVLFERPDTAGGCWDKDVHFAPHKILVRQIGRQPTATLIDEPIAVTGNIFTVRAESLNSELYLLGIINSSLMAYFWRTMFSDFKDSFPQVTIFSLAQLPIRAFENNSAEEMQRNQIVGLVEKMLDLNRQLQTASPATRSALTTVRDACDAQIDALVYALYGLTPDEIKIVEQQNK